MLWIVTCANRQDSQAERERHLPAHRDYLDSNNNRILLGGGLRSDDGAEPQGAVFVISADSRHAAQAFVDAEPLNKAGLFETVTLRRFQKGRFNPLLLNG